ncbi:MAG TPA: hypothetical protein VFE62_01350 [Gemmataceae bacterium]|nr:hypothetical protein [Gemmataceae bacterium]
MIDWNWQRVGVGPDTILDAADTIRVSNVRYTVNLAAGWIDASVYLSWARAALRRGGDDGWDSAAGWAKRAVCQRMDTLLVNNHFGSFLGRNYKDKADYLKQLKVPGLAVLRDLVIDPRNEIEHAYQVAKEEEAHLAHDVAELFLGATRDAAEVPAILALGLGSKAFVLCVKPGHEAHAVDLGIDRSSPPSLFIEGYPNNPNVLVLYPREEQIAQCPLKDFTCDQVLPLNARLRECLASQTFTSHGVSELLLKSIQRQLKL